MIRKIAIDQLCQGMYVHDLNCAWLDHRFLWTSFAVSSAEVLKRVQELGVQELYIDTAKGLDVADAQTKKDVEREIDDTLKAIAEASQGESSATELGSEQAHASRIRTEATSIIQALMDDIRVGRSLEIGRASPLLERMTESIFRNPDALMGLQRIRRADRYTFEHSVNVAVLLLAFARSLDQDYDTIQEIGLGGLLHDIGKSLISQEIINKPGRLTRQEFEIMKRHASDGAQILSQARQIPPPALKIVAEHHERIDGSGYPNNKANGEISLFGRMASIVDVYDAITSDRAYHRGVEPSEALRKLLEWSSHHFEPKLVHQFIRCVGIYPVGTLVRLSSDRVAAVVESSREGLLNPVVRVCFDLRRQRSVTPFDLNLSDPKINANEQIVCAEPAKNVPIDLEAVLTAKI